MQGLSGLPRQKELLDVAYLDTQAWLMKEGQASERENVISGLVADVSQNIGRRPWGLIRTFTQSSQVYCFERDRLLLPHERLRCLGFPDVQTLTKDMSFAEASSLVGQAMAVPAVTMACLCLLVAACEKNALGDLCNYQPGSGASFAATPRNQQAGGS